MTTSKHLRELTNQANELTADALEHVSGGTEAAAASKNPSVPSTIRPAIIAILIGFSYNG